MPSCTTVSSRKSRDEWSLWTEFRCRRETVWQALVEAGAWEELWGDCEVDLRPGGRFADATAEVMPKSMGEFAQAIPYRRFDLYWFLGKARDAEPGELGRDTCVLLTFEINQTAPSVQCVSVRARWREGVYSGRGKWLGRAQAKWTSFLEKLEARSKALTRL